MGEELIADFSDKFKKTFEPELPMIEPPRDYRLADFCYERIVEEVSNFQKSLDDEHEVGVLLASFGKELLMYVQDIGYQNPNMLYFYGQVNGHDAQLIQHMNQLNFLLLALPKPEPEKPARRIGFSAD